MSCRGCSNNLTSRHDFICRDNVQFKRFEKMGLTRAQAEALTRHLTELMCVNKEKLAEHYVSRASLEKVRPSGAAGRANLCLVSSYLLVLRRRRRCWSTRRG